MNVMLLRTGNSCRSQMAVIAEIEIDISGHTSKSVGDLGDQQFDFVMTVCSHADDTCPIFHGDTTVIHRGFDDPPKLAAGASIEQEALQHNRRLRDEIRQEVAASPALLTTKS